MSDSIGEKIKSMRESASMSLESMAEAVSLEPVCMEQIEEGKIDPSISTLAKVARCLGVRLGTILDGTESMSPIVTRKGEMNQTERLSDAASADKRGNLDYYSLALGNNDRNMEPYILDTHFVSDATSKMHSHEGEEFLYVLDGNVVIYYGSTKYELSQGDSIYLISAVPHCISSTKDGKDAKLLSVIYMPY